jgi:hypothetical protein
MPASQRGGDAGAVIIPLRPDVMLDSPAAPKCHPGAPALVLDGPRGVPEQLFLFAKEPGR